MAATGFRVAFAADATMYLVGALVIFPLPLLPLPEQSQSAETGATEHSAYGISRFRKATAGAATVVRDPGLGRVAIARMGVIFTSGAFLVVEPLYTRHVLDRSSSQFALFEAVTGIGAVITGLVLPVIRRRLPGTRSPMRLLTAGAVSCGLAAALFTGTPWVSVAYLGAFVWGICGTVFYAAAATTLQRLAPAGKLGRVAGVISSAESTTESISMPTAGALVAVAGLRPGALILAAVAVAAGAACLLG